MKILAMVLLLGSWCGALASSQIQPSFPKECRSEELKTSMPDPPDGGAGGFAHIYQVTNVSQRVCILTGVPRIRILDKQRREIKVSICANCAAILFTSRPIDVALLHPGESAHFLIGLTIIDAPQHHCVRQTSGLDVFAGTDPRPLVFKPLYDVCENIAVSAWRPGIYKDDERLPATAR